MAKRKDIYNLLAVHTSDPITLSTTGGSEVFGPVCTNDNAHGGRAYLDFRGFSTATSGITAKLYGSFNGHAWYFQTAFPVLATTLSIIYNLNYLPNYFRMSYSLGAQRVTARAMLEADSEY